MKKIISLMTVWLLAAPAVRGAFQDARRFFPKEELMSIGVYYYPEHWPRDQWERDFKKMAELGFEFTHFAEFAWSNTESEEGKFDFSWLDKAVSLAAQYGLKVILCTPSPCPPAWLGEKAPEIYMVGADGRRSEHGTRANYSASNDAFREYVRRMVTKLAERYGRDARIWGWQLDNEPSASPDYSPSARQKFQLWLKNKYGAVDNLNKAWGGNFWSLNYDNFQQVLIPNESLNGEDELSPHALLDFKRFTADVQADFLQFQADILRRSIDPRQWITTNFISTITTADPRRSGKLDFPSFTMYLVKGDKNLGPDGFRLGDPMRLAFACDYYRSSKGVTGVMELQPGQVNWARINPQPMPGVVRMWLWHAFSGGCSFASPYRFRHPIYGSELYHEGIVGPDGVTLSRGGAEYARVISEMKTLRKMYDPKAKTPPSISSRRTAVLWSHDVLWDLETHKQTALWNSWAHLYKYLAAVKSFGAPVDFVGERDDFSKYPFLIAPACQLVDSALVDKWRSYAENGGHLILSCRTGQKDMNGQLPEAKWAEPIWPLIGAEIEFFDNLLDNGRAKVRLGDKSYEWNSWADVLKPFTGTETVAVYADQFYSGKTAIVSRRLGKGSVTYVGADTIDGRLEKDALQKVYERAGVNVENYPEGVYVEWRDGFHVGVNYSSSPALLKVPADAVVIFGKNPLAPADVLVWKEK